MKTKMKKRKSEASLYKPIEKALHHAFEPIGKCYLEISARNSFSERLKTVLTDFDLFINLFERYSPDIMGYVDESEYSKPLIVVEVKPSKIKIKDIFQTKQYAQVFDAKYALLISPEPLSEEIKRILKEKHEIILHHQYNKIFIGKFNEATNEFTDWYPEPLKKATY